MKSGLKMIAILESDIAGEVGEWMRFTREVEWKEKQIKSIDWDEGKNYNWRNETYIATQPNSGWPFYYTTKDIKNQRQCTDNMHIQTHAIGK